MQLDVSEHRFVVGVDDSGIVRATWRPCRTIDENLARQAVRALEDVAGGRPRLLYIDVRGVVAVTRGGREAFSQARSVSRVALVGRSPADRMVAGFVLGASPLPVPAKFFTCEQVALQWLRRE